ncbi:hypothetical protein WJ79_12350 [Burkholderia ubonensis]|nr:hypothetical protein WJ79_12350 [Burkholderia ubonensis]
MQCRQFRCDTCSNTLFDSFLRYAPLTIEQTLCLCHMRANTSEFISHLKLAFAAYDLGNHPSDAQVTMI